MKKDIETSKDEKADDWVLRRNAKPYFICKGCADTITKPEHWSKEKDYCIYCYKELQAMKNNKCLKCGGSDPIKEYWAVCEKCWNKGLKECERENKKIAKREAKKLGITLEEYERRESEALF